eukprot:1161119-Pelagomonas_calceolata.AAC.2
MAGLIGSVHFQSHFKCIHFNLHETQPNCTCVVDWRSGGLWNLIKGRGTGVPALPEQSLPQITHSGFKLALADHCPMVIWADFLLYDPSMTSSPPVKVCHTSARLGKCFQQPTHLSMTRNADAIRCQELCAMLWSSAHYFNATAVGFLFSSIFNGCNCSTTLRNLCLLRIHLLFGSGGLCHSLALSCVVAAGLHCGAAWLHKHRTAPCTYSPQRLLRLQSMQLLTGSGDLLHLWASAMLAAGVQFCAVFLSSYNQAALQRTPAATQAEELCAFLGHQL